MGKAPIGVAEIAKNTRKKSLLLADVSQKMPHCVTNMASTHFPYIAHGNNAERSDGL